MAGGYNVIVVLFMLGFELVLQQKRVCKEEKQESEFIIIIIIYLFSFFCWPK